MQNLAKQQPAKKSWKFPSRFSLNIITIIASLLGAYFYGSFNPIQNHIPITIDRTDESLNIELKLK